MVHRQSPAVSPRRLLLLLPIVLVSGCCCKPPIIQRGALDGLLYRLSHWQENRCECAPTRLDLAPLVESPNGYLSDGPTLIGQTVAGSPGKQATDVVVGMQEHIGALTAQNTQLRSELDAAQQVISTQQQALQAATKELQLAMHDFTIVREQLRQWESGLADLDAQYQSSQRRYDSSLADLEHRLQEVLRHWDTVPVDYQLSPPSTRPVTGEQD